MVLAPSLPVSLSVLPRQHGHSETYREGRPTRLSVARGAELGSGDRRHPKAVIRVLKLMSCLCY